ncbi:hypothetical protein [Mycolicibacterium houstonense]|uniref:hypothetical protein n=1 Tax=Mycolicibacterium houstonense TaxID=146021 RepID=UPI0008307DF9|nr:hypothetical protein [Mycolicibacterium houstonense]
MQIRGWGWAAVASVALLLGGCTPQHSAPEVPATSSIAATTAQPQALPACATASISFELALDAQNIRCTLALDDHSTITVSSDPAWSFSVRNGDTTVQEFREPTDEIGQTGVAPLLQDIDQSGTPVLLVVTGRGGTGGEPMAVWRPTGQPKRFVRAGELFGFRTFYRTPEGFFGNYAHAGAGAGVVTLYRWDGDNLAEAVVLDVQVPEWPKRPDDTREWIRNGNTDCTISDEDYPPGARATRMASMKAAGVDPATAAQQFCNQPWVATLYP